MTQSTWPFSNSVSPKRSGTTVYKNKLDCFENAVFESVHTLVEIFPSPIPTTGPNGERIESADDLIMLSGHYGFSELFVPDNQLVSFEANGKKDKCSKFDYISWQLMRMTPETLYWVSNKTEANLENIYDFDTEYKSDNGYDPSSWLHASDTSSEDFKNGLVFLSRLRRERAQETMEILVDAVCDDSTGVRSWLETEISEDVESVSNLYSKWDVPIMIVSNGLFETYMEPQGSGFCRDCWQLDSMFVRNYDEGDV